MSSKATIFIIGICCYCFGLFTIYLHLQISHEISNFSTTCSSSLEPLSTIKDIYDTKDQIESFHLSKETVVIISTHLVPSHPSLDLLQQVIQSYREHLIGLPKDAPLIITVDGIKAKGQNARIDMVETVESKKIYHEYIRNLYKEFGLVENVRIVVAGINIGLSKMLKQVIDTQIDTNVTKFMYLLQHDLKFTRPVNHTALIELTKAFPDHVNIVNFKRNKRFCHNITNGDIMEEGSGIQFRKTYRWSDQNQFARISHFLQDVLPQVAKDHGPIFPFPEMRMMRLAEENCEKYGVYEYNAGLRGMYQHLDGSERLGENLAKRIRDGEIQYSTLNDYTKTHLKKMGVNVTQLLEEVNAKGLPI